MLRIRLSRVGAKRQPSYRVVVADVEAKRDGRFIERIGFYNPRTDPTTYEVKEERALYWLSVGAQPSGPVRRLLKKQGTLGRLARLHAGETLEKLVAEYKGVEPQPEPAAESPQEAAGPLASAAATVVSAVAAAAERVADVVENVVDIVAGVATGTDEEE